MGYGCKILSLGYKLWIVLKYHLSYFMIISQQCYIPTTTGARRSRSTLALSSQLLKKEFRVVRCLQSILTQTLWLLIHLPRDLTPKVFYKHTAHMGVVSLEDMSFQWEFVFWMVFSCTHTLWLFMVIYCRNKVYGLFSL